VANIKFSLTYREFFLKITILVLIALLTTCISPQSYSAQLSAHAVADNELDARAESLRRLAESIQVKVSGETFVYSQFKDNKATQELADSLKTSTDLTLLGAEVFIMKTKQGYRAEAQLDTKKSFNLYLTKIKAEKQLLDNQISFFTEQKTDLAKFISANNLIPKLSSHIEDYFLATMLSAEPQQSETSKVPQWMSDLSNKSQSLLNISYYVKQISSASITDPQLAALLLVENIQQEDVYTCPILQENGSWLNMNNRLNFEINKLLPLATKSKEKAKYFLLGHATKAENQSTTISYQLVDVAGKSLKKNQVSFVLSNPTWQSQPKQKNAVLTSINYEFKDKTGNLLPENITTEKQLYTLAEQNILANQTMVIAEPCRPVDGLSHSALANAYGATSFISIGIAGNLSTFTLRPDPKEHEFALAKVTFEETDLTGLAKISNKSVLGKKFPVLEPNTALISAIEIAFKKLN
jgi:hypothetical protein